MKATKGKIWEWSQIDQSKADISMVAGHPERYNWIEAFKGPGLKEGLYYTPQRKF